MTSALLGLSPLSQGPAVLPPLDLSVNVRCHMMPLVWLLQIICYALEDTGLNVLQVIVLMSTHSYLMLSYLVGTKA